MELTRARSFRCVFLAIARNFLHTLRLVWVNLNRSLSVAPLTPIREWQDFAGADHCHAPSQKGCLERGAPASYLEHRASRRPHGVYVTGPSRT